MIMKKKFLISFIILNLISNLAFADCNWSTGIKTLPDGGFEYSKECHIKVGQLIQDNNTQTQQITDLNKAVSLKDLALTQSDARATLWFNTSSQLEDRLQKVDSLEKHNDWLFFGLGVLTTFAAGYGVAKLIGK